MGRKLVRDVMTDAVVVVRVDTGFKHIVDALADFGVSAVPVVDDGGRVVGVVSEADLLHKAEFEGAEVHARLFDRPRRRAAKEKAAGDTAGALMTSPAITITSDASVGEAARVMESLQVKRLPVVGADGRLVGIVSRRDLLRTYLRPDSEIQREIASQVLRRTLLLDPTEIQVSVNEGRVTLRGKADRRSTADIAVRLAHGIDGVVNVVDELTWDVDDIAMTRGHSIFGSGL
jgi:CBS domain-containing protein